MSNKRIYEVAADYGKPVNEVLDLLKKNNIDKKNFRILSGKYIYHKGLSWQTGVSFPEKLAGSYTVQKTFISPDIIIFYKHISGKN